MRISVYLPLLLTVLAIRGLPLLGRRLAPAAATRVLTAVAVVAAAGTVWVLGLVAAGGLSRTDEVLDHSDVTAHQLALLDPIPRAVGAAAAVALLLLVARVGAQLWQRRRVRRSLDRVVAGAHGELVVFRQAGPHAYAVPGRGRRAGHIVVSDGMLGALDGGERRVLLAHERAHLYHVHHRYQLLAALALALNPLLRRLTEQILFQLERWADEDAATAVADRALAARSLARAGLAGIRAAPGLAFTDRAVQDRVQALLAAPARNRPLAMLPMLMAVTIGGGALIDATVAFAHIADAVI